MTRNLTPHENRFALLDGLRGVAIALVLVSHAIGNLRGQLSPLVYIFMNGLLGVRIFFVVSGFIITSSLLKESGRGGIDIKNFYLKRFTKLCPPLLAYLAVVLVLKFALGEASLFGACTTSHFGQAIFFVTAFFGELSCWPLKHTWSLSLEEIFYVTWAPTFAWGNRLMQKSWIAFFIALGPATRLYTFLSNARPEFRSFYTDSLIGTNMEFIAVGCLTALLLLEHRARVERILRLTMPWGLGVALFAFYISGIPFYRYQIPYATLVESTIGPSIQAYIVGYIILCGSCEALPKLFSNAITIRPLLYLGRISYSIYLVQQAVLNLPTDVKPALILAFVGIPFVIAAASLLFYGVEQPSVKWLRAKFNLLPSELSSASQPRIDETAGDVTPERPRRASRS